MRVLHRGQVVVVSASDLAKIRAAALSRKRRDQLQRTRDELIKMHRALRWDQHGTVGAMVSKMRVRLERAVATIDRRVSGTGN